MQETSTAILGGGFAAIFTAKRLEERLNLNTRLATLTQAHSRRSAHTGSSREARRAGR